MGGLSCLANFPPMVDQDIRVTAPSLFGKQFLDVFLNLVRIFVLGKAQSHREPFDMRIDHYARNIEYGTQNTIGCFPSNARQF